MGRDVTASATDDLLACSLPFRSDTQLDPDSQGEAAERGTRLHAMAEEYLYTGTLETPPRGDVAKQWDHLRPFLDQWSLDVLDAETHVVERAMAYNVMTDEAQDLRNVRNREYGVTLPWIPGTLDLGAVFDDHVVVLDLKTGKHRPDAKTSGQLRTGALTLARLFDKPRAVVGIVHVRPRAGLVVETHDLHAWDLDLHSRELRERCLRLPLAVPTPGASCRFCRVIGCEFRPLASTGT